jgi:hypothetical protein
VGFAAARRSSFLKPNSRLGFEITSQQASGKIAPVSASSAG